MLYAHLVVCIITLEVFIYVHMLLCYTLRYIHLSPISVTHSVYIMFLRCLRLNQISAAHIVYIMFLRCLHLNLISAAHIVYIMFLMLLRCISSNRCCPPFKHRIGCMIILSHLHYYVCVLMPNVLEHCKITMQCLLMSILMNILTYHDNRCETTVT